MDCIDSQNDSFCQINDSCFRVEGKSVEETTNRMFKVGDRFILSNLKIVYRSFVLEWNFVSSRNCNRPSCKISYVSCGIRKSSSITCGCSWLHRFKAVEYDKCANKE